MTFESGEAPVRGARLRAALTVLGGVLSTHPEARSLLSEASHRRVLAWQSQAAADAAATTAAAARVRYDELRHLLDPRARRPLPWWAELPLLAVIAAVLAALAWLELAGLPGRVAGTVAVTAAWLADAWLAAVAVRSEHGGHTAAAGAAAAAFAVLLATVSGLSAPGPDRLLLGSLWAVLSGAAAVTAAWLIILAEPPAVTGARRYWRRAEARQAAAARTARGDADSAAIARQSWLGLVSSIAAAHGDEQLIRDAAAVAADII